MVGIRRAKNYYSNLTAEKACAPKISWWHANSKDCCGPGTLALCRKRRKRLEGLFTVTTRSLNRVQSLRSRRPGKSPAAMLGEAECASGKPGERRRHLRYPRRSRPLPHFDAFASAACSAARAPARMLAMA